ncbi:MAG: anti-sigma factor [Chloroflexota bacterium]
MDHAAFTELIAGRALGDLDPAEQRALEAHLPGCASCRALMHDLDGVLTDLAFAAPRRAVPAALGPSILAAIRQEPTVATPVAMNAAMPAGGPAPAPNPVPAPIPLRPAAAPSTAARPSRLAGWGRPVAIGLAAAASLAIVALGAAVLDLRTQLSDAQKVAAAAATAAHTREVAMQVVADPSHASAWLAPSHGATGGSALMVYLPGSTEAYLVADGLPATPDGRVYQFWYADPAGVHPGVTFHHDGQGLVLIPVDVDLRGAQAAMLTIEPDGGATAPSQDVVFGKLPAS